MNSVATAAMNMPTAAIWLPALAVAGDVSLFKPRMKSTAASRYIRSIICVFIATYFHLRSSVTSLGH
jgi:hypothetical protein